MDTFPGFEEFKEIQKKLRSIDDEFQNDLQWFNEVLVEAKRAFARYLMFYIFMSRYKVDET